MSNRMIKDSICSSEKIAGLSDFEFRLWVGLIVSVDDYGRGDARPAIIKGRVFPLRDRVTTKDVEIALHALAAKGCISLYDVGGKSYFWFPSWNKHQRIRNQVPKFPEPPAAICGELQQSAATCGELRLETKPTINQKELEIETETNSRKRGDLLTERFDAFWSAYPKKVGKGEAKKAFAKVKVSLDVLLEAISQQKKSRQWQEDGGRFIPNPSTWLNQERWGDVLPSDRRDATKPQPTCGEADQRAKENMERLRKLLHGEGGEMRDDSWC